jgi:hypothetical protein
MVGLLAGNGVKRMSACRAVRDRLRAGFKWVMDVALLALYALQRVLYMPYSACFDIHSSRPA